MDGCPYNPPSAMAPIVLAPASRSCIHPVIHSSLSLFCALARSLSHSTLPITPPTFTLFATHLPHSAHHFTPLVPPHSCSLRHPPTPTSPPIPAPLVPSLALPQHIIQSTSSHIMGLNESSKSTNSSFKINQLFFRTKSEQKHDGKGICSLEYRWSTIIVI